MLSPTLLFLAVLLLWYSGWTNGALNENDKSKMNMYSKPEWLEEILKTHNILRERHGSPPLELDYKLSYESQKWAENLVSLTDTNKSPTLKHSPTNGVGENIALRTIPSKGGMEDLMKSATGGGWPTTLWYKEIKDHDFKSKTSNLKTGHFTQVIWKKSKTLGCGRAGSSEQKTVFTVCQYVPAGNFQNEYLDNVKPPVDGLGDNNAIPDFAKLKIKL